MQTGTQSLSFIAKSKHHEPYSFKFKMFGPYRKQISIQTPSKKKQTFKFTTISSGSAGMDIRHPPSHILVPLA